MNLIIARNTMYNIIITVYLFETIISIIIMVIVGNSDRLKYANS